ncbi:hypothetical protein V2J09_002032 [Rumex salicifolius]
MMKTIILYTFIFMCVSPVLLCNVNGDYEGESNREKPSIQQRFREIAVELGKSSHGSWSKFKSIVFQVQQNFFPPSLDFTSKDELPNVEGDGKSRAAAKMSDAVGKSLRTSETAFEETAETMSKVVGEAVQKTKEKVKETILDKNEANDKDEL